MNMSATEHRKRGGTSGDESDCRDVLTRILAVVKNALLQVGRWLRGVWQTFLRSFARWADPKLEPYRDHRRPEAEQKAASKRPEKVVIQEEVYTPAEPEAPQTRDELLGLIREAPISILSSQERKAMLSVLSLPDTWVAEIMTPATKIVFVDKDEVLGPLVLDRLYHSGFTFFPIVDKSHHIIGTLRTALLNSLDIKETSKAEKIMDPRVFYIRSDYTLEQALKAFLRTGSQLMIVVDKYEKLMGMLTFEQIMDFLFNERFRDDFENDDDRLAVAKRKLPQR